MGFQDLLPADPGLEGALGRESAGASDPGADRVSGQGKAAASEAEFTEWAGASVPRL